MVVFSLLAIAPYEPLVAFKKNNTLKVNSKPTPTIISLEPFRQMGGAWASTNQRAGCRSVGCQREERKDVKLLAEDLLPKLEQG